MGSPGWETYCYACRATAAGGAAPGSAVALESMRVHAPPHSHRGVCAACLAGMAAGAEEAAAVAAEISAQYGEEFVVRQFN